MQDKKSILIQLEDMAIELKDSLNMQEGKDTAANKLRGWMTDEERDYLGTLRMNLMGLSHSIERFLSNSEESDKDGFKRVRNSI